MITGYENPMVAQHEDNYVSQFVPRPYEHLAHALALKQHDLDAKKKYAEFDNPNYNHMMEENEEYQKTHNEHYNKANEILKKHEYDITKAAPELQANKAQFEHHVKNILLKFQENHIYNQEWSQKAATDDKVDPYFLPSQYGYETYKFKRNGGSKAGNNIANFRSSAINKLDVKSIVDDSARRDNPIFSYMYETSKEDEEGTTKAFKQAIKSGSAADVQTFMKKKGIDLSPKDNALLNNLLFSNEQLNAKVQEAVIKTGANDPELLARQIMSENPKIKNVKDITPEMFRQQQGDNEASIRYHYLAQLGFVKEKNKEGKDVWGNPLSQSIAAGATNKSFEISDKTDLTLDHEKNGKGVNPTEPDAGATVAIALEGDDIDPDLEMKKYTTQSTDDKTFVNGRAMMQNVYQALSRKNGGTDGKNTLINILRKNGATGFTEAHLQEKMYDIFNRYDPKAPSADYTKLKQSMSPSDFDNLEAIVLQAEHDENENKNRIDNMLTTYAQGEGRTYLNEAFAEGLNPKYAHENGRLNRNALVKDYLKTDVELAKDRKALETAQKQGKSGSTLIQNPSYNARMTVSELQEQINERENKAISEIEALTNGESDWAINGTERLSEMLGGWYAANKLAVYYDKYNNAQHNVKNFETGDSSKKLIYHTKEKGKDVKKTFTTDHLADNITLGSVTWKSSNSKNPDPKLNVKDVDGKQILHAGETSLGVSPKDFYKENLSFLHSIKDGNIKVVLNVNGVPYYANMSTTNSNTAGDISLRRFGLTSEQISDLYTNSYQKLASQPEGVALGYNSEDRPMSVKKTNSGKYYFRNGTEEFEITKQQFTKLIGRLESKKLFRSKMDVVNTYNK